MGEKNVLHLKLHTVFMGLADDLVENLSSRVTFTYPTWTCSLFFPTFSRFITSDRTLGQDREVQFLIQ